MSVTKDEYVFDLSQLVAQANTIYSASATTLNGALALFATNGVYPVSVTNPSVGTTLLALVGGGAAGGNAYIFMSSAELIAQANTLYGSITTLAAALQAFFTHGIYLVQVFPFRQEQQAAPEPDSTTYSVAYLLSSESSNQVSGLEAYGDGSDGSPTFDGSTTILGLVPSASVYTLTRNVYLDVATINTGVTIKTANFKIFCRSGLVNNGTISNNGAAGLLDAAGTATAAGSCGAGSSGGAGSANNGAAGTNLTNCLGAAGGAAGVGGTGTAGAAGTVTAPTAGVGGNVFHTLLGMLTGRTADAALATAGTGGGGGGGDTTNKGGGGGAGAGHVFLASPSVTGTGSIFAKGGAGGNGAAVGDTGGGGGGGGAAICLLISQPLGSGQTTAVTGGLGGTKNGAGVAGTAGSAGVVYTLLV